MKELYIGLMSGTSIDSIDAVLVNFSNKEPEVLAKKSTNIPPKLKQEIQRATNSKTLNKEIIQKLDRDMANLFSKSVLDLIKNFSIKREKIIAIGSHGQTIKHSPNSKPAFSLQVGDPSLIALQTGITTVGNFRRQDIEAGGQGAPLAPLFHNYLFSNKKFNRAIVNIGGIANITFLKAGDHRIVGFDSGPGNCLMDAWSRESKIGDFDKDGAWASEGKTIQSLLKNMLKDPYFVLNFPKSTGTDYFNLNWIKKNSGLLSIKPHAKDIQATLLDLTSQTIFLALNQFSDLEDNVFFCGGGIHNNSLIESLENKLDFKIYSTSSLGLDPDFLEAVCFAWLGKERLEGKSFDLSDITGSKQKVKLGSVWEAA